LARKILLADDSVTAQNMGRKILADAGYEVITVNNGSAALKKIAELKPDLVILDVYMPGYSGLEVCQRLKESQDSNRIPVLLSVGKLEPFKPEEANRVRAEGFIVKPFEASELLAALSKLEDKVVPRSEPSKPGRFARAIAAAEESGRISRNDSTDDNGWKNRISFPHEKTADEKAVDEPPIYNPLNRDLRTVVETPAEKAPQNRRSTDKKTEDPREVQQKNDPPKQDQPQEVQPQTADTTVDVAALASAGLPKDVTPEEVAAIAAAAAQIRIVGTTVKEPSSDADTPAPAAPLVSATELPAQEVQAQAVQEQGAVETREEIVAATTATQIPSTAEPSNESEDVPITMAVANASVSASEHGTASRWSAFAVALDADESNISLEQEMQKAYAAFIVEENASAKATPVPEIVDGSAAPIQAAEEQTSQVAAISEAQPEPQPQPENFAGETLQAATPQSAPSPDSVAVSEPTTVPELPPSVTNPEPALAVSAAIESAQEAQPEPTVSCAAAPELVAASVNDSVEPAYLAQELPPTAQPEPAFAEAPISSHPYAPIIRTEVPGDLRSGAPSEVRTEQKVEPATVQSAQEPSATEFPATELSAPELKDEPEPEPEPEDVKSTAAAWASWRQIRDADPKPTPAPPAHQEFAAPAPPPADSAAMAVAAGAEQLAQEATPDNPADVASIVDSVLADLRPRLMAEITRKMAEKK